ncbi:MAG: DNA polymerase III subunit gamma/tau [Bacteroidota bacterium]|nr:DNA polymerase III subunit gamma/tau [Bacteroidota bacterium]
MENFIVSARKYRPASFDSVVGQASITSTLKNAIKNNHLAHAYLFCGPRGVGKTTCARIFAKTINCQNLSENIEACNECESCKSFAENRSFNIHELDAASNNSVEDIRNLIDQVRVPPQIGKYSVYIIDEVHMLSASAFNAFLKTLEEPPKHVIFILATTEKHKILPTILSRCQIFDFNRIKIQDTVEYLEYIAKDEQIDYEVDALNVIAQKADGAMRDALSIFDQIVSFSGSKITYQSVIENLNVLDYDYYFKLVDAFLKTDISQSLLIFDDIVEKGFDGHNFITGLGSHFRNLMVCKDVATLQLLEVGASIADKFKQQAAQCAVDFLYKALNICSDCDINYRSSRNQRLHVELALIRLCNILNQSQSPVEKKIGLAPKEKSADTQTAAAIEKKPVSVSIQDHPKAQVTYDTLPKTGVSIKDALKKKTSLKIQTEPEVEKPSMVADSGDDNVDESLVNKFSPEQLKETWKQFAEKVNNEPRLYNTLISQDPALKENFVIEFLVSNPLQSEIIQEIKGKLQKYLRTQLKNSKIVVNTVISEVEPPSVIYTSEAKFNHLLQKNPSLARLKQEFNLDFE